MLALLLTAVLLSTVTDGAKHSNFQRASHLRQYSKNYWGADLVVVVTWHSRGLDGLRGIPLHLGVRFVLLVKGSVRNCKRDVPEWLAPHVVQCVQLPNEEGRDSHSIAWFLFESENCTPLSMDFVSFATSLARALASDSRATAMFLDPRSRTVVDFRTRESSAGCCGLLGVRSSLALKRTVAVLSQPPCAECAAALAAAGVVGVAGAGERHEALLAHGIALLY
jgi:hypothetical protein